MTAADGSPKCENNAALREFSAQLQYSSMRKTSCRDVSRCEYINMQVVSARSYSAFDFLEKNSFNLKIYNKRVT